MKLRNGTILDWLSGERVIGRWKVVGEEIKLISMDNSFFTPTTHYRIGYKIKQEVEVDIDYLINVKVLRINREYNVSLILNHIDKL